MHANVVGKTVEFPTNVDGRAAHKKATMLLGSTPANTLRDWRLKKKGRKKAIYEQKKYFIFKRI